MTEPTNPSIDTGSLIFKLGEVLKGHGFNVTRVNQASDPTIEDDGLEIDTGFDGYAIEVQLGQREASVHLFETDPPVAHLDDAPIYLKNHQITTSDLFRLVMKIMNAKTHILSVAGTAMFNANSKPKAAEVSYDGTETHEFLS